MRPYALSAALGLAVTLALLGASPAHAVPTSLGHQGTLADSTGVPLDGPHVLHFRIYTQVAGGSAVWSETRAVQVDSGAYATALGLDTPFPADLFDNNSLFLSIAVDDGPELDARLPLHAVPYALRAQSAAGVSGGVVDATEVRVNGTTVINSSGQVPWAAIANAPPGSSDTLGELLCEEGDVPQLVGGIWSCEALSEHTHGADQIVSGTLSVDRLPIGTSATSVAAGDHSHDAGAITTGVLSVDRLPLADIYAGYQPGAATDCGPDNAGALRWSASLRALQVCDGAAWWSVGSARDPDVTISGNYSINTNTVTPGRTAPDGVAWRVVTPADGANKLTRFVGTADFTAGLAAGDKLLVMNTQGITGDAGDVGKWQIVEVAAVTAAEITLATPLSVSFDGLVSVQQKVIAQRVPVWGNVRVSGNLSASAWTGLASAPYHTGIVAFQATGTVYVESGASIHANALGYRGGAGSASGFCQYAANGEGADQENRVVEGPQNLGGGEGGDRDGSWCVVTTASHHAKAGGGGSHITAGTQGRGGSLPGGTYGAASSSAQLHFGGGGGGSSSYRHNSGSGTGGAGGAGGGAVLIWANSVQNRGAISANGANGANHVTHGGGGGGGAGGSVLIRTGSLTGAPATATGGTGGTGYTDSPGGNGGAGLVRVE